MDPEIDSYIGQSTMWPGEMVALRRILLGCGLDEQIKWGKPCYRRQGRNLAIMQEMKGFLALMFFKGTLLDDPAGLLRSQGPNSRSAKRLELTSVDEIEGLADTITAYVFEATAVEEAGLQVDPTPEMALVPELAERLARDPELAMSFEALTPGRRREYNLHIGEAKQARTRHARIDRHVERIRAGKGMRDR